MQSAEGFARDEGASLFEGTAIERICGGIGTTTESYTYDADSNVLSFVTRKGDTLSFSYDTLNRMCTKTVATTAVACSATSAPNPTTWFNHDLTGKLIAANDNSASVVAPASAASYATDITYDALNHPLDVSWNPAPAQTAPSAASVTFQYSYDSDNHRVTQTATNSSWWSYPAATASSLGYTANALNQYSAVGSVVPLYDADGNLVYDGTFTFDYDAQSRLTEILNGATAVATYAYDAQGRRKSKTIGSTTTIYVTDADDREVLEYDGTSGAEENWYAYGLGSNDVLNQMSLTGSTRETMIPDVQGSFIATLDASSGTLANAGYQTFGENPTLTSGTFRYTGQRFDPETAGSASQPSGLYYYRSRMYCVTWGRFCQPDPGGYAASGMNLYAYVGNDPLDGTDPYGRCYPECTAAAGAVIGGIIGGGAYVATNWNNLTWGGFFARTTQGAVIGGLAGAGDEVPLLALAGAGAASNTAATFVQQASQNNLQGYYGSTFGQNALQVTTDATIGGLSTYLGGVIGQQYVAPAVNNFLGSTAADILANPNVSNEFAAGTVSLVQSSEFAVEQASEDVSGEAVNWGGANLESQATTALGNYFSQPSGVSSQLSSTPK